MSLSVKTWQPLRHLHQVDLVHHYYYHESLPFGEAVLSAMFRLIFLEVPDYKVEVTRTCFWSNAV